MGLLIRLVELLIVIVPLVAVIVAGVKAVSMARGRQNDAPTEESPERERSNQSAQWQTIMRTTREHDRTDTRWLDYELDVGKLLDYPLITDMRNPLTQRFHRAKLRQISSVPSTPPPCSRTAMPLASTVTPWRST